MVIAASRRSRVIGISLYLFLEVLYTLKTICLTCLCSTCLLPWVAYLFPGLMSRILENWALKEVTVEMRFCGRGSVRSREILASNQRVRSSTTLDEYRNQMLRVLPAHEETIKGKTWRKKVYSYVAEFLSKWDALLHDWKATLISLKVSLLCNNTVFLKESSYLKSIYFENKIKLMLIL